jgi:hypothetical protein
MAFRVTPDEVRIIMREVNETDFPDATVNAYITGANATINENLVGQGLSTALLKEIERWLSAHLMAISQVRTTTKEKAGTAELHYIDNYGTGLGLSEYGQTVKGLDSTGILSSLGGKAVSVFAITEFDD